MKKKLICALFALILVFSIVASAFAAQPSISYEGKARNYFTTSGSMTRPSTMSRWTYVVIDNEFCYIQGTTIWTLHGGAVTNGYGDVLSDRIDTMEPDYEIYLTNSTTVNTLRVRLYACDDPIYIKGTATGW